MSTSSNPEQLQWPRPRIEIERMAAYSAPLEGRRNLLRLDFNENTIGPSPKVMEALEAIKSTDISIYPEYKGLKEALIKNLILKHSSLKLDIQKVGLFNGVDAAIHAIFHAYGERDNVLLTTTPTFGYYSPCAQMQGMDVIEIPYIEPGYIFPLEGIKNALKIKIPKLLFICNPNNPTGSKIAAEVIIELATENPHTLIVVDELYEAFNGDSVLSVADFNRISNVIVLQSLSKSAGLAGLRIGFAIGNQNVIEHIKRVTGPYDINSFAVVAALAALEDQTYTDNYVEEVLLAREWIKEKLDSQNIKYHLNGGNYLLIWPKMKPDELAAILKIEGILIRNMSNKPLIHNSLRVSIGTRNQMKIFWDAFKKHELNNSD